MWLKKKKKKMVRAARVSSAQQLGGEDVCCIHCWCILNDLFLHPSVPIQFNSSILFNEVSSILYTKTCKRPTRVISNIQNIQKYKICKKYQKIQYMNYVVIFVIFVYFMFLYILNILYYTSRSLTRVGLLRCWRGSKNLPKNIPEHLPKKASRTKKERHALWQRGTAAWGWCAPHHHLWRRHSSKRLV